MEHKATRRNRPGAIERAREMRKPLSPPEAKLWSQLRNNQCAFKFRRQHPIGPYFADFYCASCRLVVELDGDSHGEQLDHDAARTAYLNANGYSVIRFANRDVVNNIVGVLEVLMAECQARMNSSLGEDAGEKRFY